MASPLRPQFFCTRPNGTLTPLIAVDDLPAHLSIRGVPRVLSPSDTQGMTSLGTVSPRAESYVVEGMPPTSSAPSSSNAPSRRPRDYDLQSSLVRLANDENLPSSQRMAFGNLLQQNSVQNWTGASPSPTSGWMVANGGGGGNGSLRQGGGHYGTKKEYCSYWIRHGECDYQQQGCLYKHEMPTDPSTLEKLGLRDIPRWYREKFGIPSLLPNGHALPRSHLGHGQPWKDDTNDRNAMKAIQYPPSMGGNGVTESPDAEKGPKQRSTNYPPSQQHSAILPGHPRGALYVTGSPKGAANPKYGPKHVNKKIDLLSFHPFSEYSALETINYPDVRENPHLEDPDRAKREDLVRNLQSLVPSPIVVSPEYKVTSFDPSDATQSRSKKGQKSRRLFQPRSQFGQYDISPEKSEIDSLRNYHANATASSSAASGISKDTVDSHLPSPVTLSLHASNGPIPMGTPTRGGSPSIHSAVSLSSESSPCGLRGTRLAETEPKPLPAPIGSHRSQCKRAGEFSGGDR